MSVWLLIYWLDGHVNTVTCTDESDAIERWKDLRPFMNTVRCFVTDEKGEIKELDYIW